MYGKMVKRIHLPSLYATVYATFCHQLGQIIKTCKLFYFLGITPHFIIHCHWMKLIPFISNYEKKSYQSTLALPVSCMLIWKLLNSWLIITDFDGKKYFWSVRIDWSNKYFQYVIKSLQPKSYSVSVLYAFYFHGRLEVRFLHLII